jgi:hypothetical protein
MTATTTKAAPRRMSALRQTGVAGVRRAANREQLGADGVDGWAIQKADGTPVEEAIVTTATDTPTAEQRAEKAEADLVTLTAELETLRAEKAAGSAPAPGTPEAVAKAMETLDPELRAHFAAVQKTAEETGKRAEEAERVAKAEESRRIDGEWVDVVKSDFTNIGVTPKAFAPVLRAAWDALEPEQFAELERVLRSAEAVAVKSDAFKVHGSGDIAVGGAWAQIQKAADDIRAADPTITPEVAVDKAIQANPALKAEYDKENGR